MHVQFRTADKHRIVYLCDYGDAGEAQERVTFLSAPQVNGVCSFRFGPTHSVGQSAEHPHSAPGASRIHSPVSIPCPITEEHRASRHVVERSASNTAAPEPAVHHQTGPCRMLRF